MLRRSTAPPSGSHRIPTQIPDEIVKPPPTADRPLAPAAPAGPAFSAARFADAAIEGSDGTVYFSDASTRFGFDRWYHDFIESSATGRLLRYDPRSGKTSVVLDGLGFANGVALPRNEAFVVVCESSR